MKMPRKNVRIAKVAKIGRIAKRITIAVFQERDPIWSRRLKRPTKRLAPPHWEAIDVTSYHVGCGKGPVEAVRALIQQIEMTRFVIADHRARGHHGMSASVLVDFAREVPLEEWERVAGAIGLVHRPEIFPCHVWRLTAADVEVRWGWPTEEEARKRRPPAKASGAQVTSYHDRDLPENARVVLALEEKLGAVPECVPELLRPHLEAAKAART